MRFHSTVLFVNDIERTKDFYTRVLGFSIEHDFGKNVILNQGITIWEITQEHPIARRLQTRNESNRFELYFENEFIEDSYNQIKMEGVHFFHDLHEEPWGQQTFRFFDPDGHLIEVGEPLATFVTNMSKKGLTIEKINQKSGVPIETIKMILNR